MDRTDLTGYAALLGESLTARVDLLERLLGGSHYPSLGQYKERLLAQTIRGFLPTSVEVGTGFVVFPHRDESPVAGTDLFDPLNQSAYSVSRQCDILVFDIAKYPPIFRDGSFVVVRPESVRAVIEVKGSLTSTDMISTLEAFSDFAEKWRATQLFYLEQHQETSPAPGLFVMAWRFGQRRDGRRATSPTAIRNQVSKYYATRVVPDEADGYPLLSNLYVHNECEIVQTHALDIGAPGTAAAGWHTRDGRFIRMNPSTRTLYRDKDRTIASLLAALHWHVGQKDFNRFFSYVDEVAGQQHVPYEHFGVTWAWDSLAPSQSRTMMRRIPINRSAS